MLGERDGTTAKSFVALRLSLGGDDFDFDQEFGAHELGDDQKPRGGRRIPEEARANLGVGGEVFGPYQTFRDLHHISDLQFGPGQDAVNWLPVGFGLAGALAWRMSVHPRTM